VKRVECSSEFAPKKRSGEGEGNTRGLGEALTRWDCSIANAAVACVGETEETEGDDNVVE